MTVRCTCSEFDRAELAWAAGFFDGEGTTFAKSDSDRAGYFQLSMTVPQLGRDGIPEVLVRFQRAVLSMGVIDAPNAESVYRWRTRGFVDGQATLALVWGSLGHVKRLQAARAMKTVISQYRSGRYLPRGPKSPSSRTHPAHQVTRTTDATSVPRAWAAGLFDAEGWIGLKRGRPRADGTEWYRVRASVSQHGSEGVSAQVLSRFASVVGVGRIECHGKSDDFKWVCDRLDDIMTAMEVLRPWLGQMKREQADEAMRRFRGQHRVRGDRERCARGHVYDAYRMKSVGMRHICRTCARLRDRVKRSRAGIPPRPFTRLSRRYNS